MRTLHTLGWACYLGASWTWVIGMLLPILLLRDYGSWGWVVFAVPNVLGAAAFAFLLDRRRSAVLAASHLTACLAFSRVTMAYQVIVLPWAMVALLDWPLPHALAVIVAAFAVVFALAEPRPLVAAATVTVLSLAAVGWFFHHEGLWLKYFASSMIRPRQGGDDLAAFAVAAAFGFALCPYLDLTFHHARQRAGRTPFVLGFGIVFLTMIVFSLAYAIPLSDGVFPFTGPFVRLVLGLHLALQAALTVVLHLQQVRRFERTSLRRIGLPLVLFLLIGAFMLRHYAQPLAGFNMTASEMVYRVLLMLYGTMFPVYVLVMMTPMRRSVPRRSRLRVALFAGGMSLPMAFIAFIEGYSVFVVGIVITFIVAWLVTSWPRRTAAPRRT